MQESRFCIASKLRQMLFILTLLSSMAMLTAPAIAERIVEIPAVTDSAIIGVAGLGVQLLDAKIEKMNPILGSQPRRVLWNRENGYVTGLADEEIMERLVRAGIPYRNKGLYNASAWRRTPQVICDLPYQWGWPRPMLGWPTIYGHTATIADFDGNGDVEVQLSNIPLAFSLPQSV